MVLCPLLMCQGNIERERFEAKKIVRKILRANNVCAYIPYMVSFAAFRGAAHHLSVLYLLRVLL